MKAKILPLLIFVVFGVATVRGETLTVTYQGIQSTSTAYTNTYSTVTNDHNAKVTIAVKAGEVVKILNVIVGSGGYASFSIGPTNSDGGFNSLEAGISFVGPGYIYMSLQDTGAFPAPLYTIQITRNDETFVPSGAVLVPADSSGPVQVVMESSTNLTTWTPALPGTYGTTSQSQYFRVRAVRQTPP